MRKTSPIRRLPKAEIALGLFAVAFSIALVELFGPLVTRALAPPPTVTFFEESGETVRFDPVRGYRLASTPARFARFCAGRLEFEGVLKGNNQGFPDADDFELARGPEGAPRVAVFGDSFTAAQFVETNWPDRVEDLAQETGRPLVLLNLAVDGAGLANWWSILHRWALPGGLQADLVVFAVFAGDLERHFSVSEHHGYDRHMFGRVPGWEPETFPKDMTEAKPVLEPLAGIVVDHAAYEEALKGHFPPAVAALEPPQPRFGRFLLSRVRGLLARPQEPEVRPDGPCGRTAWDPRQLALVEEMDRDLDRLGVRRMVVFLGEREEVVAGGRCRPLHEREFAERLHAQFVDGREMFAGKSPEERRAHFFPVDGHWNQRGSDAFARFVHPRIEAALRVPPQAGSPAG